MGRLFHQFSFPGGVPSHVAPETPGSIHEGGELGYSMAHAHGAAFDNPDLVVACVIGDGEAETGPLATSWHSGKFLNPARDGAVLPILHLNGWKIANPTVLARIPEQELDALLRGYGYAPVFITGSDPQAMHAEMAGVLDHVISRIREIQGEARSGGPAASRNGSGTRERWPMIVMRTPKGWTGPAEVDGVPVEGTWRAHQVPLAEVRTNPAHLRQLEEWMRSYRPGELFVADGQPRAEILGFVPPGERRMGSNPHANGGLLLRDLNLPDFRDYAVTVNRPGATMSEPTRVLGYMLRDVARLNAAAQNFRVVGPDETQSNRLDALLEVTGKTWEEATLPVDEHLATDGRVMEILSETTCQGWLEGYLLTGRHGLFSCYEAFIHIVDSMFNQHAKWLKISRALPWRRPVASLNYLLTSHVWRQDHNGFSHQDPGFIDHVVNKKAEVVRVYLPPDTNTLLSVGDHCCEYMTGGHVVVLGPTGKNFAAGMSGGIAYVLDEAGDFATRVNRQMVELEKLTDPDEIEQVWKMIQRHQTYTKSERAAHVLADWKDMVNKFVKVIPKDYQRVLQAMKKVSEQGLTGEQAIMAAFEENVRDVARVGGG